MITKERLDQLLEANFQTGELVWKFNHQRPDLIGCIAGHINNGYFRISIDGTEYYRATIIWIMFYGKPPVGTVDHKDLNGLNDSIDNLREATKAQNVFNSKINSRNTSGFKGVSFCRSTNRWRASIRINGVEKNLGRYFSPEAAHEAWKKVAIETHGEEFVRT